ncbi:MAG TPA: ABC transporter permease [Gemmatimonadaceae bacterium]|jgi:ABC-2 type transport system permease protein
MDKIFIVAKREYLERVRTRAFVLATLLVPLLMSGAFLVPIYFSAKSGTSPTSRKVRILDATGAGLGEQIATNFRSDKSLPDSVTGPFVVAVAKDQLPTAEASAAREVVATNGLTGYLVIDDSTLSGNRARYVGRNASSLGEMDQLKTAVRQAVTITRLQREGVKPEIIEQVSKNSLQVSTEKLTEKGRGGGGAAGLLGGILVGVLLLMSIIIHGQNIMRGVLEEKTTRVAEIVISSIKPDSLLAGKILGVGAVGLTQVVAWFALSGYITQFLMPLVLKAAGGGLAAGANMPSTSGVMGGMAFTVLLISLAYFLVGFLFYATLFAAAGSMVSSDQEAQQAAQPIIILLMTGWIFVNPVLLNPNSKLAVVLSWLPWASPIIMPMRMGLTSVSPLSIAGSLLVALLGSLGAVWLAARIYRVGMLMYGKKPTFAELGKWIRHA